MTLMRPARLFIYDVFPQNSSRTFTLFFTDVEGERLLDINSSNKVKMNSMWCVDSVNWKIVFHEIRRKSLSKRSKLFCAFVAVKAMENMNGQPILNGQGHMKGNYSHEDRIMKNGSSGSNSSK